MNINTTIPQPMPGDNRLYVDVITEGMKGVKALVDTGAAISVLALEVFYKIPRRDKLKTVPVNPSLRLSSASGGKIEIVGRYMLNLEFPKQDEYFDINSLDAPNHKSKFKDEMYQNLQTIDLD